MTTKRKWTRVLTENLEYKIAQYEVMGYYERAAALREIGYSTISENNIEEVKKKISKYYERKHNAS